MRACVLGFAVLGLLSGPAFAYENYVPLGLGYSTLDIDLSKLTPAQRAAIGKADIYESDIYNRQIMARQHDSRMMRLQNDRNFDPTDMSPNY